MYKLVALYPNGPDVEFDFDYYTGTHDRMAKDLLGDFGLSHIDVDRGLSNGGDEDAPYRAIGTLFFETLEGLQEGLTAHAETLLADIPNFSNVEPTLQVSEGITSG